MDREIVEAFAAGYHMTADKNTGNAIITVKYKNVYAALRRIWLSWSQTLNQCQYIQTVLVFVENLVHRLFHHEYSQTADFTLFSR